MYRKLFLFTRKERASELSQRKTNFLYFDASRQNIKCEACSGQGPLVLVGPGGACAPGFSITSNSTQMVAALKLIP